MLHGLPETEEGVKKQLLGYVLVLLPGKNLNIMNVLEKFKYDNRRRTSGDETPMFTPN